MYNLGLQKGRGIIDQIAYIHCIMEKAREFQKNIYFCFIDYAKAFDSMDQNKLWKILKDMGVSDHLTCLLRNLCAGQEATIRTGLVQNWKRSTTRWYTVTLLINLYAKYMVWNARLDESQIGIKIAGRNVNNLRYADDTTLMAESEEELEPLDERGKWKSWLKLQFSKN